MKKILIPTDFSSCAYNATEYAFSVAAQLNCELEFLHIISTPINWLKIPLDKEELYPEILEKIRIAKNEFADIEVKFKEKNLTIKTSIVFNIGSEDIAEYINESEYELIVIGSHGVSGVKEKLIGSNAQRVIRNSTVPVLVVKNNSQKRMVNVAFVSDFEDVSKQAFNKMAAFASKMDMKIQLLYVDTHSMMDSKVIESKMDKIAGESVYVKHIVKAETIEEGLQEFTKNMDMICISTHGKSGLKQLFSPSIAESVANHIDVPLLSIKL